VKSAVSNVELIDIGQFVLEPVCTLETVTVLPLDAVCSVPSLPETIAAAKPVAIV